MGAQYGGDYPAGVGISEYLRVIWRRKWRVLAVAAALTGIVYARSESQPERYRAEAILAVSPGRSPGREGAAFLARSVASLAETRPVIARAIRTANLPDAGAAVDRIDAVADVDVGLARVIGEGDSPRVAEQLAQSVASAAAETLRTRQEAARDARLAPLVKEQADVEQRLAALDNGAAPSLRSGLEARYEELARALTRARLEPLDRAEIVAPARAGTQPVEPQPARDALLTLLGSLIAFSLLAVLIEALSDRFSTERPAEEASRVTGLPVLAEIPRTAGAEVVESFRALRTSLMFMSTSERLRTLAVVSVDPGAGKTFVALNLSREAAGLEVPVVLIDGDLRRPVIHDRLGLPRSPGLSEALAGTAGVDAMGHLMDSGWLRVLPSGAPVADPAGLFGGRAFREALDAMTWAELVVVDTPAGALFADAMAIASQCDAALVVVDAQNSRRRAVRRLVEGLRHVSAQPIGVVLNRTEPVGRASYYERPRNRARASRPTR